MTTALLIILITAGIAATAYIIMILIITAGWFSSTKNTAGSSVIAPFISVITAARNESETITACLNALALQNYPSDNFEVIVVDDGSSDTTVARATAFATAHPEMVIRIYSLQDEIHGASFKKAALACGISKANGQIIAVTDADCVPETGWLRAMSSVFNETAVMMAFGLVYFRTENSWLSELQSLEFMSLVGAGAGAARAGFPFMCNGASMAFRKEAFYKTGAWVASSEFVSGDDVFLLHQIKKIFGASSIRFVREKGSSVCTSPQPSISGLIQQRIRWASKARGYHDTFSLYASFTVFMYSFVMLALAVAGSVYMPALAISSSLFVLKLIVDIPLLAGVAHYLSQKNLLRSFLPMQLFYPFYIVITAIGGLFGKYTWKGRSLPLL